MVISASTNTIINSANTLSINSVPGQNFALGASNSNAIFSFGNFSMEQTNAPDNLIGNTKTTSFTPFSTLGSFSSATFSASTIITETENQLNPDTSNPQSYAYFGSFYTKLATAINNIITNFPYAILSNNFNTANTIFNYSFNTFTNTSSFSIPISGLTNQGNVVFSSGYTTNNALTVTSDINTVYNNPQFYSIQLSATTTASTQVLDIINYSYTSGNTGYLQFTVSGFLFDPSSFTATTSIIPIYIRPSLHSYANYKRTISNLENQILFEQVFLFPEPEGDTFINQTFVWPMSIDGFNPDGYGVAFDTYSTTILAAASEVDNTRSNWMLRTMIPENYTDLDTPDQIYTKLINVYAQEFDKIKIYQDNLAYMHNVTYNNKESIPNNFINKLSNLMGFDFVNGFNNSNVFDYYGREDSDGMTLQDYNFELWKRMLININWIYKKKGTRDALMFIPNLIGAPPALIVLNEFVYNIVQSSSFPTLVTEGGSNMSDKINLDEFINYNASSYIFQQGNGGLGAGNGQAYLDQWSPEFTLNKQIDNLKIRTGDTVFGTENIVNTKELELNISPANAIETDMFEWYGLGLGTWLWSSTGTTVSPFNVLPFSGMSVPFEWQVLSPLDVFPPNMTAATVSQWINFIYTSNINPQTRKTYGMGGHNSFYMDLKKIYMTYMLWTNNQNSNRLTFGSLEQFLELIERNIFGYLPQLMPATAIVESAVIYKNTIFNRQKFVYPKGLNDGSEFQLPLPISLDNTLNAIVVNSTVAQDINDVIESISVSAIVAPNLNPVLTSTLVNSTVTLGINNNLAAFVVNSTINLANTSVPNKGKIFYGKAITFPAPTVLVMA